MVSVLSLIRPRQESQWCNPSCALSLPHANAEALAQESGYYITILARQSYRPQIPAQAYRSNGDPSCYSKANTVASAYRSDW